jgi:hypothetical protein
VATPSITVDEAIAVAEFRSTLRIFLRTTYRRRAATG